MKRETILLVNPNRMRPPIAPIGVEYVAADLIRSGFAPVLCDLTFAEDWRAALDQAVADVNPMAVGVSVRNIDDAYFASRDFTLRTTTDMVRHIRSATDRPVILGGVGFSCAPVEVLRFTGAAYGVTGEGEQALPHLLKRITAREDVSDVSGAVFRRPDGKIVAVPPRPSGLEGAPAPPRRFVDNPRYFTEGGQAGIETKRGCAGTCIYCVDPVSNGKTVRLRPPDLVADEFEDLLNQGVDVFHLCDSEFNLPPDHAYAVCEALVRRGLASKVRWYTYASPKPFDACLAKAMAGAGCAGINFGVDHVDPAMLRNLGRSFTPEDVRRTARACRDAGLALMFDLLLGGPGETHATIAALIDFMREVHPDCAGLSCGVRIYPNTQLAALVRVRGPLADNPNLHGEVRDNEDFLRPIFYVDAHVGAGIHQYVTSLVDGDPRFFHADPAQVDGNYNYNDNSVLAQAIRSGERGAYWDILRRLR